MTKKVGVSMGGTIEYTRSENTKNFIRRIDNIKKRNAKVCLNCESNKEGFCDKHKGWCNKVNYICNGFEMSYQDKINKSRSKKNTNKKNKKNTNKAKKKVDKRLDLGQVIKPNFDTAKCARKNK